MMPLWEMTFMLENKEGGQNIWAYGLIDVPFSF